MRLFGVSLGEGNAKVGQIYTFSLPSHTTCPGASRWCLEHCYAHRYERLRSVCRQAYQRNLVLAQQPEEFVRVMTGVLPRILPSMRIHVSGDFHSRVYVNAWERIATAFPQTRFWTYTRSWVVPDLLGSLERLRALANVQVFASTDPTMSLPPSGWRGAFVQTDPRASGMQCRQQHGHVASCLDCGYCFRQDAGSVVFLIHEDPPVSPGIEEHGVEEERPRERLKERRTRHEPAEYEVPVFKLQLVQESTVKTGPITTPGDVAAMLTDVASADREQMVAVFLSTKHWPVGRQTVSIGTLNASLAHPREVFKGALLSNAHGLILAHNHPSGSVSPSQDDDRITAAIADAGRVLNVSLLDHVILSPDGRFYSYREEKPECLKTERGRPEQSPTGCASATKARTIRNANPKETQS